VNTATQMQKNFVEASLQFPQLVFALSYVDLKELAAKTYPSLVKQRDAHPSSAYPSDLAAFTERDFIIGLARKEWLVTRDIL